MTNQEVISKPKFVIKYQNRYLKVQNGCIIWTYIKQANTYSSRYAAKKHIKTLNLSGLYLPTEITIEFDFLPPIEAK